MFAKTLPLAVRLFGAALVLSWFGGAPAALGGVVHIDLGDRPFEYGRPLDLDGDGVNDLSFWSEGSGGWDGGVTFLADASGGIIGPDTFWVGTLAQGELISAERADFRVFSGGIMMLTCIRNTCEATGSAIHAGDEILIGFRFLAGDGTHVGWARVANVGGVNLVVRQVGYETVAGAPLHAGELGTPLCGPILQDSTFTSGAGGYVPTGGTFALQREALGQNISYQWLRDGALVLDGPRISGSTTGALRVIDADPADSGNYSVRIASDCAVISTVPVRVYVSATGDCVPTIIEQPQGRTAVIGESLHLRVNALGDAPTYQWFKNDVPLVNDGRVSGADTTTLSIQALRIQDAGEYRAIATGRCGAAQSQVANVIIETLCPPRIDSQPVSTSAAVGQTVHLAALIRGNNPILRWARNGMPLVDGGRISGAGTSALTITDSRLTDVGDYRLLITSDCGQTLSDVATVDVVRDCAPLDGACLLLHGAGYASAPDNSALDLTTTATIEGWFRGGNQPDARLVSKGDGQDAFSDRAFDISYLAGSGGVLIEFFLGPAYGAYGYVLVYSGPVAPTGSWNHFAATIDTNAGVCRLYVNGQLRSSTSVLADGVTPIPHVAIRNSSFPLMIGATAPLSFFSGRIEEVRIWNVARSASQIAGTFDRTVDPQSPGLVACYHFDEGAGLTAHDATGHHHDAALLGVTEFAGTHPCCPADFNGDGTSNVSDLFDFIEAWFAGSPAADFGGGGLGVDDVFRFLNAWFAGC